MSFLRRFGLKTGKDFADFGVDCKTVGFFLKISKEIGKAWHMP